MTNSLFAKQERDQALKAAGQTTVDGETIALQILSGILAGVESTSLFTADGVPLEHNGHEIHKPWKIGAYGAQALSDLRKGREASGEDALKSLRKKANPFFTAHKVEDATDSPVTQRYLTTRRWKKMGGSAFQLIGELAALAGPPVNVAGVAYHGQAAGLTGAHMLGLAAIAWQHRDAERIAQWCQLIYAMKTLKLGIRGSQVAGSIVPAASLPTSIVAAFVKAGIKNLTIVGACYAAAAQIHWSAYVEQGHYVGGAVTTDEARAQGGRAAITRPAGVAPPNFSRPLPGRAPAPQPVNYSRPLPQAPRVPAAADPTAAKTGPGAGPASKIMWELFTRRSPALRVLGKYDVGALIKEPAGWMALADKLTLI